MTIAQQDGRVIYKAPRIALKDYSGPAGRQRSAGFVLHRRHLPVRDRAIRAHQRLVRDDPHDRRHHELRRHRPGSSEFNYSGLSLLDIKEGKIGAMTAEGIHLHGQQSAGRQGREADRRPRNIRRYDFDAAAPPPPSTRRRQATTGPTASTGRSRPVPIPSPPPRRCGCASTDLRSTMSRCGRRGCNSRRCWRSCRLREPCPPRHKYGNHRQGREAL